MLDLRGGGEGEFLESGEGDGEGVGEEFGFAVPFGAGAFFDGLVVDVELGDDGPGGGVAVVEAEDDGLEGKVGGAGLDVGAGV